jgi:hypothetical protein
VLDVTGRYSPKCATVAIICIETIIIRRIEEHGMVFASIQLENISTTSIVADIIGIFVLCKIWIAISDTSTERVKWQTLVLKRKWAAFHHDNGVNVGIWDKMGTVLTVSNPGTYCRRVVRL